MPYNACDGRPAELVRAVLCLDELSKDVKGELMIFNSDDHVCRDLDCKTRTVEHLLRVEVVSHPCDSPLGKRFDGKLMSRDLTTVFVAGSGMRRGMHTGTFQWNTAVGIVKGRLSGMTNEGTHREPAFKGCQQCGDLGVMEGRLCGRLTGTADPALVGVQVTAAYRFAFEPTEKGGKGPLQGTIEGLVVRNCAPSMECVSFDVVGDSPMNPRPVDPAGQVTVETRDRCGGLTPLSSVVTLGGATGLHLSYSSTIEFARTVSRVELTLVHMGRPATATAFDNPGAVGAVLDTKTMTVAPRVPEMLPLSGAGIRSVKIDSPSDEVILTRLCWTSEPTVSDANP